MRILDILEVYIVEDFTNNRNDFFDLLFDTIVKQQRGFFANAEQRERVQRNIKNNEFIFNSSGKSGKNIWIFHFDNNGVTSIVKEYDGTAPTYLFKRQPVARQPRQIDSRQVA